MRPILIIMAVVVTGFLAALFCLAQWAQPDPARLAEFAAAQEVAVAAFDTEPDAKLLSIESTTELGDDARYLVVRWRPKATSKALLQAQSRRLCASLAARAPGGFKTVIIAAVVDARVELGPLAFGQRQLLDACSLGEPIEASKIQGLLAELDSWR